MNVVRDGQVLPLDPVVAEPKKSALAAAGEKVKAVGAAAVETAKVVGTAFVDQEASKALQEVRSTEIAEAKANISAKIKTGLETAGDKYYQVLSMPIAPIANLKTKEFTPDENASGLTNLVKKALNADANLFKTIAVGTEKFAREAGAKTYTVIDQGLSYFTNLLECVGLGNLGRLIQKTLAIVISAIVRAVLQTVSQVAHVVPVALFLAGCVVAAVAAIKLAQEAITGTILLATVVKQNKEIQDLKAQNAALRQLETRLAKVEADVVSIDEFLTDVENEESESEEVGFNDDAEALRSAQVEEDETTDIAPLFSDIDTTPAPRMSKAKKAAYGTAALTLVGGVTAALLNRQAVVNAAYTYAPALAARVAPFIPAVVRNAVGL